MNINIIQGNTGTRPYQPAPRRLDSASPSPTPPPSPTGESNTRQNVASTISEHASVSAPSDDNS